MLLICLEQITTFPDDFIKRSNTRHSKFCCVSTDFRKRLHATYAAVLYTEVEKLVTLKEKTSSWLFTEAMQCGLESIYAFCVKVRSDKALA